MLHIAFELRLMLTALHYNENADRQQAQDRNGVLKFSVRFPKYKKGEYSVTPVKESPTFGIKTIFFFSENDNTCYVVNNYKNVLTLSMSQFTT